MFLLLFAVASDSTAALECRKCEVVDFRGIDVCLENSWVRSLGNGEFEACEGPKSWSHLPVFAALSTMSILFVVIAKVRRARLEAHACR